MLLGIQAEAARAWLGPKQEAEFEVWPDHVDVVEVFLALATQWRMGPMGGAIGLDYAAIPPTLDLLGHILFGDRRPLFDGLRAMERAALKVWSES